jgi:hypothetical protein
MYGVGLWGLGLLIMGGWVYEGHPRGGRRGTHSWRSVGCWLDDCHWKAGRRRAAELEISVDSMVPALRDAHRVGPMFLVFLGCYLFLMYIGPGTVGAPAEPLQGFDRPLLLLSGGPSMTPVQTSTTVDVQVCHAMEARQCEQLSSKREGPKHPHPCVTPLTTAVSVQSPVCQAKVLHLSGATNE